MAEGKHNIFDQHEKRSTQPVDQEILTGPTRSSRATGAGYEIRVKDHLETYWYAWFEGWSITNIENGEMLLSCSNVDRSALHGILNKIRDLNLELLSVRRVKPGNKKGKEITNNLDT